MATVSKVLGQAYHSDGTFATLTIEYDNVSLLLTSVIVENGTPMVAHVDATSSSNGRSYSVDVPANTNFTQAIPGGAANRLQLSVTPSGKLDGVGYHFLLT